MKLQRAPVEGGGVLREPRHRSAAATSVSAFSNDVAVLVVARMHDRARLWGFLQLVKGTRRLSGEGGLRFAKLLGSGHDGRFGLRPSASVFGLFAVFEDAASADAFAASSALLDDWRAHAQEMVLAQLRACSSRGSWDGRTIGVGSAIAPRGRVASLTRASIRLTRAAAFWRRAPPAQASLDTVPGCQFAVGLGEAPLLRQATFSVWENVAAMDAYARDGAHLEAIRAARAGHHFSESMFVRFEILALEGSWHGERLE